MRSRQSSIILGAAVVLTLAIPTIGTAADVVVHFGQPQPQDAVAANTHLLLPDDVTINQGDSVTFVVNGGGHGIAIHPVNRRTTRQNIADDLCQGPQGTTEADRLARATVCNGTIVTSEIVDGVTVMGTQNLDYSITDARDNLVIHTGFNTATRPNPRVDDAEHTERLLATSGRVRPCGPGQNPPACDASAPAANQAGAFLVGTVPPATPGNRIQVQFQKPGRYLVICMNRGHFLNDHMFGFVTVISTEDQQ